jgi:hypothetical protein
VDIKLTPWLLEAIQNGEAILFLGAGSTIGARRSDGTLPPNGSQLRDLLSDKFLAGKRKEWPLDRVADYAKNVSSLGAVQSFIRQQFEDLRQTSIVSLFDPEISLVRRRYNKLRPGRGTDVREGSA